MRTETYIWRGINFKVVHGDAPKNRYLYRFIVEDVSPVAAHLPLDAPRYDYHYVDKSEITEHGNLRSYLIARLERDATPALLQRNARVEVSRQLCFDLG